MTMRNTLSGLLVAAAAITAVSMPMAAEAKDPFGPAANAAAMQMWLNQQAANQNAYGVYNPYVNNIYNTTPYYNGVYPSGFAPYYTNNGYYPYGYQRSTNTFGRILNNLF